MAGSSEECSYTVQMDTAQCQNQGCKKLVISFSGGQMTCPNEGTPASASVLTAYAADGAVAVCARAFETPSETTGSGSSPYHQVAPRVDALVNAIVADPIVQAAWSGDFFLFTGVSNGATVPVLAMAHNNYDNQTAWKGNKLTAACFFDGIYSIPDEIDFINTNNCFSESYLGLPTAASCQRLAKRYGCDPNLNPCACDTADTALDTITAVDPENFAISRWKLIECGSAYTNPGYSYI